MRTCPGWQTWLMLVLPPITLGTLILGFLATMGPAPGEAGAEEAVRKALPYILVFNHGLLFAVLVLILRRNGESLKGIGWTTNGIGSSIARELTIGVLCALGLYLFKEMVIDSTRALLAGRTPTFTSLFNFRPGSLDVPLAVAATTLVFVEESIYRGFAIPSLKLRYGTTWAVVITSAAFGMLHWGNGVAAILATAVFGLLFAAVFLWRRNLVAVTVAHALYNLAMVGVLWTQGG